MSEYLKQATLQEIQMGRMYSRSILNNILKAFLSSDLEIARVETSTFKNPMIVYNGMLRRSRKYNLPIQVIKRKENIYLVKIKKE
jgi:hypothetical protein